MRTYVPQLLFDELKLDAKLSSDAKLAHTENSVKSTSESVLNQISDVHPLPSVILQYRQVSHHITS